MTKKKRKMKSDIKVEGSGNMKVDIEEMNR